MSSLDAFSLELEIRRQVAIDNHAWCYRLYKRANKTETDSATIVLSGVSHSKYRRHFGNWNESEEAVIKSVASGEEQPADRAQAHRFSSITATDPYYTNRTLYGEIAKRPQGFRPTLKRARKSDWAKDGKKQRKKPKTKTKASKKLVDIVVKKESREVALWRDPQQLSDFCNFGRFQSKRIGAFDNCKVYGAGSIVFITRVTATYVHHYHCPKVVLEFDTSKLHRDQTQSNTTKLLLSNPWDRIHESW